MSKKNLKCENCIEWEYFEGYGYGCFCMRTMMPIDANKCEEFAERIQIEKEKSKAKHTSCVKRKGEKPHE